MKKLFKDYLTHYFQDAELKSIVTDILGTYDSDEIAALIEKQVSPSLEANIEKILFLEPSAGVVMGFLLTTGEKIVLKIYNRNNTLSYLEEMNRIQQIFYHEKFPAPNVLSPIFPFYNTHAGLYELIEGEREDSHDPLIRSELAKYLARFTAIVDKYQFAPIYTFMQISMKNKLWPTPHNVLFDLKKSSRGAGWITKKALAARKILTASKLEKKLAYTDWDVKNTIFKNKKLVGVFDWDALGAMSEPAMVGSASAQFTADWESGNKVTPTPDEARAFVREYEFFRGRALTESEYRIASAAADYLIALISRFEHAGKGSTVHPFQDLLKECGEKSFLFA